MAVYYIASASSGGSTGNTGLSAGSPWPLSKLNTFEVAGDKILINKGDTLSGTTTISRSGSSGNPIIYDSYGSSAHNPIFDGAASASAVISITGNFITFNNLTFQNTSGSAGLLHIGTNIHDIIINNCYFNNGILGVNAVFSGTGGVANLKVLNSWFANITDVNNGSGSFKFGNGNPVQFNNCNGAGMEIAYNNCYTAITIGSSTTPFVGDILSIYQCNGTSGSNILVHDNNIRGGGSSTPASPGGGGKAGIVLGDKGGSYQQAYNNIVCNGGASSILVQGGTFINMSNNIAFSVQQPYTSVALGYGNYSGAAANNNTIGNNKLNFKDFNGNVTNTYIDQATGSAASTATGIAGGPTLALPTGWASNTALHTQDPGAFDALLSNPLWTGTPWDIIVIPVPTYGASYTFTQGIAISTITPGGGSYYPVTSYSISPGLPSGLSFNTTTGQITGTPSALLASTNFTVTANSIGGQGTFIFNLQVVSTGVIPYYTAVKFI